MTDIGTVLLASLNTGLLAIVTFVPKFLAGAVILIVGIVVASIFKQLLREVFKSLKVEALLSKYGVPEMKEEFTWSNILSEIVRWFVIVMFLIPTADVWGLPQIITVLNQFLLYLPNAFVAAIIALVGLAFARIAHDVVLASSHGISREAARAISSIIRWAIVVFVFLAVLNQLGVAADLVRILFTGFVAMLAISGGIAFGLGGQAAAKDVIEEVKKKLQ